MIGLNIVLDGDGAWPDMVGVPEATLESVGRLTKGTSGGHSSVAFRLRMPDGSLVIAQTTMKLFLTAADAMRAVEQRDYVATEQDGCPND